MAVNLKSMSLPIDYSMIEEYLYLGNVSAAIDTDVIKLIGAKRVLTVRQIAIDLNRRLTDVQYRQISVNDTTDDDLLTHFPTAHMFIFDGQKLGQPVYVHCRMGRSRSVTIVISYLMWRDGIGYEEAYKRVRNRRSIARPNSGFRFQLKLFEAMNYSYYNCIFK